MYNFFPTHLLNGLWSIQTELISMFNLCIVSNINKMEKNTHRERKNKTFREICGFFIWIMFHRVLMYFNISVDTNRPKATVSINIDEWMNGKNSLFQTYWNKRKKYIKILQWIKKWKLVIVLYTFWYQKAESILCHSKSDYLGLKSWFHQLC